jgi:NADH:ubiquinone oxidoreductase subunit D
VPALEPLKLVAGLDLRGRGDVQMYRIEMPGPVVTKDIASDSKVRLEIPRAAFNELATKGHVSDWRDAFARGEAKVTGIEQVIRLIAQVVERQEERSRTRRAKQH